MQSSKLLSSRIVQRSAFTDVAQRGSNSLNIWCHHKVRIKSESQHGGDQCSLKSDRSRSTCRTDELDQCAAERNRSSSECVPVETPHDGADKSRRLLSGARSFESGGNDEEDDRGARSDPKSDSKHAKKLDHEQKHRVILSEIGPDTAP